MTKIAPCLWFDGCAEEAARFYASVFPDSAVTAVHPATVNVPSRKMGETLTVEFTVLGMPFVGLNGGPLFKFNEAVSFQVYTDTQEETDRYWDAIVNNGGKASACGWCTDRYGLYWQITPRVLMEAISNPDNTVAARAMEAMQAMGKIDIAKIQAAVNG